MPIRWMLWAAKCIGLATTSNPWPISTILSIILFRNGAAGDGMRFLINPTLHKYYCHALVQFWLLSPFQMLTMMSRKRRFNFGNDHCQATGMVTVLGEILLSPSKGALMLPVREEHFWKQSGKCEVSLEKKDFIHFFMLVFATYWCPAQPAAED